MTSGFCFGFFVPSDVSVCLLVRLFITRAPIPSGAADPEARRFQHAVLTNTHKHSHTQGLAEQRNKCKPVAYCLPAPHSRHTTTAAAAPADATPGTQHPGRLFSAHTAQQSTVTHGHPLRDQR